jgi:hypothetical protein
VENPRLASSAPIIRDPQTPTVASAAGEATVGLSHGRHAERGPATPFDVLVPEAQPNGTPQSQRLFDRPDRVEFLDDRVVLFCAAGSRPQTFSYALRVTAAGEFILPPIQASCMYDPAVACLGAEGRVKTAK